MKSYARFLAGKEHNYVYVEDNEIDEADFGVSDRMLNSTENGLSPLFMDPVGNPGSLMETGPYDEWITLNSALDSGAIHSVAPPGLLPGRLEDSPWSKQNRDYRAASGGTLPNLGQQRVPIVTEAGGQASLTWQIASVTKPLLSVGHLCDRGNTVVFSHDGGYVENASTGARAQFRRDNGVCHLTLYVPRPHGEPAQGFQGQGAHA